MKPAKDVIQQTCPLLPLIRSHNCYFNQPHPHLYHEINDISGSKTNYTVLALKILHTCSLTQVLKSHVSMDNAVKRYNGWIDDPNVHVKRQTYHCV